MNKITVIALVLSLGQFAVAAAEKDSSSQVLPKQLFPAQLSPKQTQPFDAKMLRDQLLKTRNFRIGNEGGGGGNTLNGEPIESYVQSVAELPSFKSFVEPLKDRLSSEVPGLANGFTKISDEKPWYFVPVHLEALPPEISGILFPSDQVIIQTKGAVWVDAEKFSALNEKAQGTLILHELLMGILLDQKSSPLDANDHDSVRMLTTFLPKYVLSGKFDDLIDLLGENGFGKYSRGASLTKFPQFSANQFYSYLKKAESEGKLPTLNSYAESSRGYTSTTCVYRFDWDEKNQIVKLGISYRTENDGRSPEIGARTVVTSNRAPERRQISPYNVIYLAIENAQDARPGDIRRYFGVWVNQQGIYRTQIGHQVCRERLDVGECKWGDPSLSERTNHDLSGSKVCGLYN